MEQRGGRDGPVSMIHYGAAIAPREDEAAVLHHTDRETRDVLRANALRDQAVQPCLPADGVLARERLRDKQK
jgi:hypothetical protein